MRPTALERAFQLARSGDYASVADIRDQLRSEGLSPDQISGPTLIRQLRLLCSECFTAAVADAH